MNTKEQIEILQNFITVERFSKFQQIIQDRTRYLTVVLEDIYQSHNASAVLRSCELLGVQDVHIIENKNKYEVNPDVALGSSKWLSLYKYKYEQNNTLNTIKHLKEQGYRIVATTPHKNDVELNDFQPEKGKFALVFGSELPGISDVVLNNADEFVKIKMYGFTESFNISVSVAVILHNLTQRIRNSEINWQLTETEKNEILLQWLKNSIKGSEKIIKKLADGK